ncbi:MAG: CHAT domain-containing protein, partial [Saprospiraceae bacterium]|nr:CHAT domain-containing protein [Saprospiraceae bacterium]
YDLKYNAQPITIEQVQKKLTNYHGLLIEYYLGQEHLYIFVISHTQEHLYRLNLSEEFQSTIDSFKTKLISNNDDPKTFQQSSNELYNILIKPFDNLLTNQKITIIPDGELGYIPFEILAEDTNDVSSFDLPYLLKNHVISYAYSATYLEDQRAKEELKNDIKYIAFAPNFRGRNDQGTSLKPDLLASRQVVRGSLSELKGATREVESLASNFQGRYFQNLEATETQFKKFAQDYDIIHLATHAIIDEVNPLNSRLLFTIDGDTLNDGDLNAWELFNMNLHAKLSVLSACNTGFGKIQKGEGILSLGRAFAFAGCPSRLMSLWPAQDASTADIMIKFYEYLAEGMAKDEALRKAKLAYLKNAAEFNMHPFYWAGFVLQGDPSAIINNSHIKYYLIGLSGVILLGFFLNKRFGYTKNRAEPSKKSI